MVRICWMFLKKDWPPATNLSHQIAIQVVFFPLGILFHTLFFFGFSNRSLPSSWRPLVYVKPCLWQVVRCYERVAYRLAWPKSLAFFSEFFLKHLLVMIFPQKIINTFFCCNQILDQWVSKLIKKSNLPFFCLTHFCCRNFPRKFLQIFGILPQPLTHPLGENGQALVLLLHRCPELSKSTMPEAETYLGQQEWWNMWTPLGRHLAL